MSVFPFKVLCHQDNDVIHKTLSITQDNGHHDCSFCSYQFNHDILGNEKPIFETPQTGSIHFNIGTTISYLTYPGLRLNKSPPYIC